MSQNDFNLANQGFPSMRADMNSAFQALASNSSGATSPATTYAYQWWYDTATDILKFRNGDNDAWIDFATFDQTTDSWSFASVDINGGTIDGTVIGGTTAAAISGTTGAFSGDVTVPSINGGPLAGFRNAIINGNFDHWQRGTSFSGFQYGADRWTNGVVGSAATQSRQAFALGQADVPNEPEYFARTVVSSVAGAGNLAFLDTKIEGVRTFAGQTASLSFWAKADAAKSIAVEFVQVFGAGGSPSAAVTGINITTLNLTTSWQKFTITASIPSIAGKTLGTNDNDYFGLTIWFDAGSNFDARTNSLGQQSGTFDIAQVQLEAGSVATPFERRPVGTELALCQRYFTIFGAGLRLGSGQVFGVDGSSVVGIPLPASMRVVPSVAVSGARLASLNFNFEDAATLSNTIGTGTSRLSLTLTTAASGYTAGQTRTLLIASGGFLSADSEL